MKRPLDYLPKVCYTAGVRFTVYGLRFTVAGGLMFGITFSLNLTFTFFWKSININIYSGPTRKGYKRYV